MRFSIRRRYGSNARIARRRRALYARSDPRRPTPGSDRGRHRTITAPKLLLRGALVLAAGGLAAALGRDRLVAGEPQPAGEGDGAEVEPQIAHRTARGSAAGRRTTVALPRSRSMASQGRRLVESRTVDFLRGSRQPSNRSPIRKWFGEPPGIGPNRPVSPRALWGAEKRQFAGQKRRTTPNPVPLAMQKVVGSSPISRLEKALQIAAFLVPGRRRRVTVRTLVVETHPSARTQSAEL
jgi:hypothetical protein